MRRLADAKLLSAVELNAAEERYRAAEMALLPFRERVDQLEVDSSTARLKLTELQTSLRTLDNESRTAVRNARVQYDQALASLVQERENVQIQARALESKIAQASRQVTVSEGRLEPGDRDDAGGRNDCGAQGEERRRDRGRRRGDRDGGPRRRATVRRSQGHQQGRRVPAARRGGADQSRCVPVPAVRHARARA